MRLFLTPVIFALAMLSTYGVQAAGLSDISNQDAVAGLKEALSKGSQAAVQQLGAENGFFGNEKLRIPLPESLQKVEGMMRRFGMGSQADELVLRMNRAAEAAMAGLLDQRGVLPADQRAAILEPPVRNVVGLLVGEMRPARSWLG